MENNCTFLQVSLDENFEFIVKNDGVSCKCFDNVSHHFIIRVNTWSFTEELRRKVKSLFETVWLIFNHLPQFTSNLTRVTRYIQRN